MNLKAVSLFSGCGGFDLGVSRCGVDIIWANDVDPYASVAYRSIFPDTEFLEKDIKQIKSFPQADILIGCYPCTGFSQAAKRKWMDRQRDLRKNPKNFLFQEFLRAIEIVQPKIIFIENVKGMLSASNGYFFEEQKQGLASLGFDQVNFKLLNSAQFGVPQSRERVFIVGVHKKMSREFKYEFLEPTHGRGLQPFASLRDTINDMALWPEGEFFDKPFHGHYLTRNRKKQWDDPSFTIVAHASHVPLHPAGDPMIKVGTDQWELQGDFNRRLSYKECLRIQGLPDSMELIGSLNKRYMVAGNAVPPTLAETIVRPVAGFFRS